MNIDELKKKIAIKRSASPKIYAVIQPDAIYFSGPQFDADSSQYPLEGREVVQALIEGLKQAECKGSLVDVTLNVSLYQSFQIDKPNIPESEWPAALPFLLKDQVRDKATDIVADAYEVPNNKVQAYVVTKAFILELHQLLTTVGCSLGRVLPEQEVWPHCDSELTHFLLLQRSAGSGFKLEAFHDKRCIFQRTLRGIEAPITDSPSEILQLEGLALELQRSTDYLSSQNRQKSLHVLKVCCDEENNHKIVQTLNGSLSIKASLMSEHFALSGDVLLTGVEHTPDYALNLFQEHLKPTKDLFTLNKIVSTCGVIALLMSTWFAYEQFQLSQLQQRLSNDKAIYARLVQERKTLEEKAKSHKPSADKIAQVADTKKQIDKLQFSLDALQSVEPSRLQSYAGVLEGFADITTNTISINQISISGGQLSVQGFAQEASDIPAWVESFKEEFHLVGRTFEKLHISRDGQGHLVFRLSTKKESKR